MAVGERWSFSDGRDQLLAKTMQHRVDHEEVGVVAGVMGLQQASRRQAVEHGNRVHLRHVQRQQRQHILDRPHPPHDAECAEGLLFGSGQQVVAGANGVVQ